ncbi:hypothetical protein R8Z57_04740 [Microbacterium sp. M3]|uniref:DUF4352 domain-containing protein n=1 Tax=Microbacterium arthrosphaerae TaxID=792652 RepID=A0ABU4GYB8_9MICO|nr:MULTISPECIES: hypothetical protein [Microbacterium]MDW4572082.1 hypothetical protein [Microbacterium arthrosphaerae]MDW7605937.1 hypothetical protein [Microbacterium sp. M3]
MPRAERAVHRWAAWVLGGGLVVAAWFVALGTPDEETIQAPLAVTVPVGEEAEGRNLVITITDIRRAAELHAGGWSAEGNWVVVDLEVAAVASEDAVRLRHAELIVDGVRYGASERPESLLDEQLTAGVPRAGGVAFELPAELDSGEATLELALKPDSRLDSMIVVPFDFGSVPATQSDELADTRWAKL